MTTLRLGGLLPIAGTPVGPNFYCSQLGGIAGLRVGADGLGMARFAWGDQVTGIASNVFGNAAQKVGFVELVLGQWRAQHFDRAHREWRLREGYQCTLSSRGDYWTTFWSGAEPGWLVYADHANGQAIAAPPGSIPPANASLTPWTVQTRATPGESAIISTF
jgi:hypothetical protein